MNNNAVFLGWRGNWKERDRGCFMPNAYPSKLPIRKDGSLINPYATGSYVNPELDPEFLRWDFYLLYPGKPCFIPVNSESLMKVIKDSTEFAKLEYAELVTHMYDSGATGEEVYQAISELGGMIVGEAAPKKAPVAG